MCRGLDGLCARFSTDRIAACHDKEIGTLKYMAPEQCLDAHGVDEQADVYALGVIAYEMLAGQVPFSASTGWDLIGLHLKEPPPPLPDRGAGDGVPLPAVLRTLVLDMLAKSPLARPTMSDVATRLSPLLKEGDGGPPSPTVTLPRKVARRRRLARRATLGAALCALVTVAGAALWMLWTQRQTIERQRGRTLAATAQVLRVINRSLRPLPAARTASQELLDLTGGQLSTLLDVRPRDREVREAMARLHALRGDFARHHGTLQDARQEYERAVEMAQALLREWPGEATYRTALATAHDGLGDALEQLADLAGARRCYDQALALRQELLRASPGDAELVHDVVASHLLLGDLARAQGLQAAALTSYDRARDLLEPVWKREPDKKGPRWQLCGVFYRQSITLLSLGRSVDSLTMAERAHDLLARIAPTDQQGSSYQMLLSRVLQSRCDAREWLGRAAEAEADCTLAYSGVAALLKAAPTDVQSRRAVIDAGLRLVDLWLRLDRVTQAEPLATELLAMADPLVKADALNQGHRWRLAACLQRMGDVLLRRGQVAHAQSRYQQALEIQEALRMQAPSSSRHRDRVVALAERLGDAAGQGPYPMQALPHYDQALQLLQAGRAGDPAWQDLRLSIARILRKRATLRERAADAVPGPMQGDPTQGDPTQGDPTRGVDGGRGAQGADDRRQAMEQLQALLAVESASAVAASELAAVQRDAAAAASQTGGAR